MSPGAPPSACVGVQVPPASAIPAQASIVVIKSCQYAQLTYNSVTKLYHLQAHDIYDGSTVNSDIPDLNAALYAYSLYANQS